MMSEIQISDAKQDLAGLIAALEPGEEVVIVDEGKRIAVIRKEPEHDFGCKAGSASGKILFMSEDFDAPLDDFSEYMQ
jgi:antitoxin (DNA-binding transcriptional repressor) of toxin-antitoxin stability system